MRHEQKSFNEALHSLAVHKAELRVRRKLDYLLYNLNHLTTDQQLTFLRELTDALDKHSIA